MADRPVQVITDSAADLPRELAISLDIRVVPLTVTFGNESFADGVDIAPAEFLDRLRRSHALPTTSQPTAGAFRSAFQTAMDEGKDVVCVTLSSGLSGTWNAARLGVGDLPDDRIRVIDSQSATMQEGWVAIEAVRAAQRGASLDAVVTAAESAIPRASCLACLQTLDYLHKGGRIGAASRLIGTALAIKPILGVRDGIVHPVAKVRTWRKALGRMIEMANEQGELQDIAVLHGDNERDAHDVAGQLAQSQPNASILVDWCGSTILTYAGPGAIGILSLARSNHQGPEPARVTTNNTTQEHARRPA